MKVIKTPNHPDEAYYVISITAENNDADYITTNTQYGEKFFNDLLPALELLITKYSDIHGLERYYNDLDESDELIDIDEYLNIPYGEFDACHTLMEIKIMYYDTNGVSYNPSFTHNT